MAVWDSLGQNINCNDSSCMQEGTLRDPYDSDEGFLREERLDMRLAESKRALQEVTFELPEAKELINIGRPL